MPRPMRTFIGLRVAPGIREGLARVAAELRALEPSLRPPHVKDLHVTLQFLGQTPDDDVHRIARELQAAAATVPPIPVHYVGLGAFPNAERARVAWVGVREEPEYEGALEALADAVGTRLENLGYPPERRRYHPHVTLGRLRKRPSRAFVERLEAEAETAFGAEVLSEANFILSDPGPRPYRYIDLTKTPLGGDGNDGA